MVERIFSSPVINILNRSLDVAELRQKVIADNIANVDTPGFKRREVIFEQKLRQALEEKNSGSLPLKTTNSRHINVNAAVSLKNVEPEIKILNGRTFRNDGNNVDIDVETAEMSKNKILYDALAQSMTNELRLLRIAISGRR
ncbi:flagellar basal body rod protein FlgB [Thermosyntropha sp.]|uniref:flagellar basal body rod protein FlgB n=1 Tax=Thermosyntropha sp. TaxID=2740820 RepID=UPI0025E79440|nr:flagellar basal body rod protein FlgB [Thermosyntropha sp.]